MLKLYSRIVLLFLSDCSLFQVAEQAQVLGSGLLGKGCQPNPEQLVGIFAQNRPEVQKATHSFPAILRSEMP